MMVDITGFRQVIVVIIIIIWIIHFAVERWRHGLAAAPTLMMGSMAVWSNIWVVLRGLLLLRCGRHIIGVSLQHRMVANGGEDEALLVVVFA